MMHRATIETAVTKALLDAVAWGAAMPAFLDTVESVTDAVMATQQAPPADPTRYKSRSFQIEDEGQAPPADLREPWIPKSEDDCIDGAPCEHDPPCAQPFDAPPADLREQVARAMRTAWIEATDVPWPHEVGPLLLPLADAVLAVFAERERLLRERIEALPVLYDGPVTAVDLADVLAEIDRHA